MKKQKQISLDQIVKTNVFIVPEGYFLSLSATLEQKILATNTGLKMPVFIVPEGYFEQLPQQIIAKLPTEKLSLKHVQPPFIVPDSYFDKLTEKIKTAALPENELSQEKSSESIHAVPEGYFDTLPSKIQARISEKKRTTVIPLYDRPTFRYAMAACFVAVLLISYVLVFRHPISKETEVAEKKQPTGSAIVSTLIANLKKEDIQEYLEAQGNIEVAQLMEYSSTEKKEKIRKEFEKDLLNIPLNEADKKTLEIELNDLDLSDLDAEI